MGAPEKNTNAKKYSSKTKMWSCRLPLRMIAYIKKEALRRDLSQTQFIVMLVEKEIGKCSM